MIQKQFVPAMENEFLVRGEGRDSERTFPVRVSPLELSNRQLLNKIRINHSKLPSKFFANPRSMPDLLNARTPSLEAWRKRRQKTVGLDDGGSKEATRSLKDYRSTERRRERDREQERKINELFVEADELAVTFSRLPARRVENGAAQREVGKVYLKKACTEPYEQLRVGWNREPMGSTMKIECLVKARQGISVRKNNHPVTTLREIKRQCM